MILSPFYIKIKFLSLLLFPLQSPTLDYALKSILLYEDLIKKTKKLAADEQIIAQKKKMEEEEKEREKELQEILDRQKIEVEDRVKQMDDWGMVSAWDLYDRNVAEFAEDYFSTDDAWVRKENREELFALLDTAIQIEQEYWVKKDIIDVLVAEGTIVEHTARLHDYIGTLEGSIHHKYELTKTVLQILVNHINIAKALRGKQKFMQTQKEITIRTSLISVEDTNYLVKPKYNKAFLVEEEIVARKYGSVKDFIEANTKVNEYLYTFHKNKIMNELNIYQVNQRLKRSVENLHTEHNLISNYGSRSTQWEYVYDNKKKYMVYLNVDTLQIIHRNSAICEVCDKIYEQSEKECSKCDAKRSTKNGLLYRPPGVQSICVD